jgi:8-oxo-dGTP pyrophosphatase MutT (NUDIX family)
MSSIASNPDSLASADDLPQRFASALEQCNPAANFGRRFAPELSYGRHFGPAPITARAAAVIVLLIRRGGRWHIPLTQRPSTLLRHGGQISLPGGTVEPGESSANAATRELVEELGIDLQCDMLGPLASCYVYVSNFLVTPWLAATREEPLWRPRMGEVERVVELPLETLLGASRTSSMTIERGPVKFRAPCLQFGDDKIWGATAIILDELANILPTCIQR